MAGRIVVLSLRCQPVNRGLSLGTRNFAATSSGRSATPGSVRSTTVKANTKQTHYLNSSRILLSETPSRRAIALKLNFKFRSRRARSSWLSVRMTRPSSILWQRL
jgi:hypothetical protein